MTEGAALHLLYGLLWYVDDSLVPRKCSAVRVVGHVVHLAKEGTHRTSETIVRAYWFVNVGNEVKEEQLISMKRADASVEPLTQHLFKECMAASLPPPNIHV